MFTLILSTLARAADVPAVWDWSTPHQYRLTADELSAPPFNVGLANNIMAQMTRYTVNLEVTCAEASEPAAGGGTTVACIVDDAALTGFAAYESDRAQLDETLRQLESWLHGATVDFVQRDDGVIKRVGEVKPGPDAPRMRRDRTEWLNDALKGCLQSLNVAIVSDAMEWRTPMPAGPPLPDDQRLRTGVQGPTGQPMPTGSLELHVTGRANDRLSFQGERGETARISVEFDRQMRAITQSHVYYAMLGNDSYHHWSREFTSELLDAAPAFAAEP